MSSQTESVDQNSVSKFEVILSEK